MGLGFFGVGLALGLDMLMMGRRGGDQRVRLLNENRGGDLSDAEIGGAEGCLEWDVCNMVKFGRVGEGIFQTGWRCERRGLCGGFDGIVPDGETG